jgi:succinate dehydrogenase/fumarate reductase flavoprotein subunit
MTAATPTSTDIVVLGSGAAGLTAALTASLAGLRAILVEHCAEVGGTSARSSGTVWVPGNHYLPPSAVDGDLKQAARYLETLVGNRGERAIWEAFLEHAPRMTRDLAEHADIAFRPYAVFPDYRQDCPGAGAGGRPLEPMPFDGRRLGPDFARVSWPLPELMLFGGMMITRGEALALLRADRSPRSLWLALRLVARYARDRLGYKRGTRLVLGNALVARLFKAVLDRGVPVLFEARATRLIEADGRIGGVELVHDGRNLTIEAGRGVILAGGGFPSDARWRAQHLPQPVAEHTPAHPGCDGSTIALALQAGAALGPSGLDNALWFPSSVAKRADGSTAVYPHIVLDRAKPGLIAINAAGERFVDEAVSYHEFVRAMYRTHQQAAAIPAWLICDRAFIRRYGLGLVRPRSISLSKHVANGYLRTSPTIEELARSLGLPPKALAATVRRFNGFVSRGVDEDFGKGGNIYDRSNGDPAVEPNPCLGRIETPPFYAVEVWPTPLGTSRGLRADVNARVLTESGEPIPGLYVCGNDMQSPFGGEYPGAGGQLGQGMTFAWIAARHAAASKR